MVKLAYKSKLLSLKNTHNTALPHLAYQGQIYAVNKLWSLVGLKKSFSDWITAKNVHYDTRINGDGVNLRKFDYDQPDGYFVLNTSKGILITDTHTASDWHTPHQCNYVLVNANQMEIGQSGLISCLGYRMNVGSSISGITISDCYYNEGTNPYSSIVGG